MRLVLPSHITYHHQSMSGPGSAGDSLTGVWDFSQSLSKVGVTTVRRTINWFQSPRDHTHHKVWDEITYPFPNYNGAVVVWECPC